jgi:hypothetical protein
VSKEESKEGGRPIGGEHSGIRILNTQPEEGKLKQRIMKEINADWHDKLFRNADYEKGELVTQEQILNELFDEAKAEWADIPNVTYEFEREAGKDRWFKKWIGGEK